MPSPSSKDIASRIRSSLSRMQESIIYKRPTIARPTAPMASGTPVAAAMPVLDADASVAELVSPEVVVVVDSVLLALATADEYEASAALSRDANELASALSELRASPVAVAAWDERSAIADEASALADDTRLVRSAPAVDSAEAATSVSVVSWERSEVPAESADEAADWMESPRSVVESAEAQAARPERMTMAARMFGRSVYVIISTVLIKRMSSFLVARAVLVCVRAC